MTIERISGAATVVASKNGSDQQVLTFSPGTSAVSKFYYRPTSQTTYLQGAMALPSTAYLAMVTDYTSDDWVGFVDCGPYIYEAAGLVNYRSFVDTDQDHGGFEHNYSFTACAPLIQRAAWTSIRDRFTIQVYGDTHPVTGLPVTGTGVITLKNVWHIQTESPVTAFAITRPA